ncbi:MAG: hypothetical protein NkDv07_0145 [Candidatus Improbicoccus devescovinae]|nr:MAG: hypothetical protein NkDv07_0145 [Candidatus Improbicoccus devescovinae]
MANNISKSDLLNFFGSSEEELAEIQLVLDWIGAHAEYKSEFESASAGELYTLFTDAQKQVHSENPEFPELHIGEEIFANFVIKSSEVTGNMSKLSEESLKVSGGASPQDKKFTRLLSASLAALTIGGLPGVGNIIASAAPTKPAATQSPKRLVKPVLDVKAPGGGAQAHKPGSDAKPSSLEPRQNPAGSKDLQDQNKAKQMQIINQIKPLVSPTAKKSTGMSALGLAAALGGAALGLAAVAGGITAAVVKKTPDFIFRHSAKSLDKLVDEYNKEKDTDKKHAILAANGKTVASFLAEVQTKGDDFQGTKDLKTNIAAKKDAYAEFAAGFKDLEAYGKDVKISPFARIRENIPETGPREKAYNFLQALIDAATPVKAIEKLAEAEGTVAERKQRRVALLAKTGTELADLENLDEFLKNSPSEAGEEADSLQAIGSYFAKIKSAIKDQHIEKLQAWARRDNAGDKIKKLAAALTKTDAKDGDFEDLKNPDAQNALVAAVVKKNKTPAGPTKIGPTGDKQLDLDEKVHSLTLPVSAQTSSALSAFNEAFAEASVTPGDAELKAVRGDDLGLALTSDVKYDGQPFRIGALTPDLQDLLAKHKTFTDQSTFEAFAKKSFGESGDKIPEARKQALQLMLKEVEEIGEDYKANLAIAIVKGTALPEKLKQCMVEASTLGGADPRLVFRLYTFLDAFCVAIKHKAKFILFTIPGMPDDFKDLIFTPDEKQPGNKSLVQTSRAIATAKELGSLFSSDDLAGFRHLDTKNAPVKITVSTQGLTIEGKTKADAVHYDLLLRNLFPPKTRTKWLEALKMQEVKQHLKTCNWDHLVSLWVTIEFDDAVTEAQLATRTAEVEKAEGGSKFQTGGPKKREPKNNHGKNFLTLAKDQPDLLGAVLAAYAGLGEQGVALLSSTTQSNYKEKPQTAATAAAQPAASEARGTIPTITDLDIINIGNARKFSPHQLSLLSPNMLTLLNAGIGGRIEFKPAPLDAELKFKVSIEDTKVDHVQKTYKDIKKAKAKLSPTPTTDDIRHALIELNSTGHASSLTFHGLGREQLAPVFADIEQADDPIAMVRQLAAITAKDCKESQSNTFIPEVELAVARYLEPGAARHVTNHALNLLAQKIYQEISNPAAGSVASTRATNFSADVITDVSGAADLTKDNMEKLGTALTATTATPDQFQLPDQSSFALSTLAKINHELVSDLEASLKNPTTVNKKLGLTDASNEAEQKATTTYGLLGVFKDSSGYTEPDRTITASALQVLENVYSGSLDDEITDKMADPTSNLVDSSGAQSPMLKSVGIDKTFKNATYDLKNTVETNMKAVALGLGAQLWSDAKAYAESYALVQIAPDDKKTLFMSIFAARNRGVAGGTPIIDLFKNLTPDQFKILMLVYNQSHVAEHLATPTYNKAAEILEPFGRSWAPAEKTIDKHKPKPNTPAHFMNEALKEIVKKLYAGIARHKAHTTKDLTSEQLNDLKSALDTTIDYGKDVKFDDTIMPKQLPAEATLGGAFARLCIRLGGKPPSKSTISSQIGSEFLDEVLSTDPQNQQTTARCLKELAKTCRETDPIGLMNACVKLQEHIIQKKAPELVKDDAGRALFDEATATGATDFDKATFASDGKTSLAAAKTYAGDFCAFYWAGPNKDKVKTLVQSILVETPSAIKIDELEAISAGRYSFGGKAGDLAKLKKILTKEPISFDYTQAKDTAGSDENGAIRTGQTYKIITTQDKVTAANDIIKQLIESQPYKDLTDEGPQAAALLEYCRAIVKQDTGLGKELSSTTLKGDPQLNRIKTAAATAITPITTDDPDQNMEVITDLLLVAANVTKVNQGVIDKAYRALKYQAKPTDMEKISTEGAAASEEARPTTLKTPEDLFKAVTFAAPQIADLYGI